MFRRFFIVSSFYVTSMFIYRIVDLFHVIVWFCTILHFSSGGKVIKPKPKARNSEGCYPGHEHHTITKVFAGSESLDNLVKIIRIKFMLICFTL